MNYPRSGLSLCGGGQFLFSIGGINEKPLSVVEAYNSKTNKPLSSLRPRLRKKRNNVGTRERNIAFLVWEQGDHQWRSEGERRSGEGN